MQKHGAFCWNELMTHDPAKAIDFYGKTLGWTFDKFDKAEMPSGMDYWMIKSGDEVGGVFPIVDEHMKNIPEHWFTYVEVDDVDKRAAGVVASGGKIMREPFDVPGVGRIVIVKAPGGAVMGWITSASQE